MSLLKNNESEGGIVEWKPQQLLREIGAEEIKYSRGFLRSRPEKWFPGFAAHWLTLSHSLGVEMQVSEVRPALRAARTLGHAYLGSVLGERLMLFADSDSLRVILSSITPGAGEDAEKIVLEYLARRFMVSLGLAWSGPESSKVKFQGEADTLDMNEAGAVKLAFTLNNQFCAVWILLGSTMVDQLDRLWRRQIKSSGRMSEESQQVKIEAVHTYLNKNDLNEALRNESFIQFDSPPPEYVTLRRNEKSWLPGRLAMHNAKLIVEVLAAPIVEGPSSESSARLSVVFGAAELEGGGLPELTQPGAILQTEIELSNKVEIHVDDRPVTQGRVFIQNGRMAVRVGG